MRCQHCIFSSPGVPITNVETKCNTTNYFVTKRAERPKSSGGWTQFLCTLTYVIQHVNKGYKNKHAIDSEIFYLLNAHSIFAIFLWNWTYCVDSFSLLLQRYVRKGNDAKNFVIKRTRLNAAHVHLAEKLRLSAIAETCRFQTVQSWEFQEVW